MTKPKDDQLDDFFKNVDDNLESLADFSQSIKQKLDDSLQKSGYQSWSEMLEKSIDSITKQVSFQSGQSDFNAPKAIVDRSTFIQNELSKIRYNMRHRGAFRDGHLNALHQYAGHLLESRLDTQYFRGILNGEIVRLEQKRSRRRDRYQEGFVQALKDIIEILNNSDIYMMSKVREELHRHR